MSFIKFGSRVLAGGLWIAPAAAWPSLVLVILGLILVSGLALLTIRQVLFGPSDAPAQRLERLIRAWRSSRSTERVLPARSRGKGEAVQDK